jgi:hypothetical protein
VARSVRVGHHGFLPAIQAAWTLWFTPLGFVQAAELIGLRLEMSWLGSALRDLSHGASQKLTPKKLDHFPPESWTGSHRNRGPFHTGITGPIAPESPASPSGSPVMLAPLSSARDSRDREIAIWMSMAKIGASITPMRPPTGLASRSSPPNTRIRTSEDTAECACLVPTSGIGVWLPLSG